MKLRFRPAAENDLIEIGGYIARDDPRAVAAFIAETPYLGRERPEIFAGLRSFPVGQYVIFYRVAVDAVDIVNVLHGARDIEPLF